MKNIDKPFGPFPVFLLFTGCRRGEALALTWEDIDLKTDTIYINLSVENFADPFIKPPKTNKGNCSILLLPELKNTCNQKSTAYYSQIFKAP